MRQLCERGVCDVYLEFRQGWKVRWYVIYGPAAAAAQLTAISVFDQAACRRVNSKLSGYILPRERARARPEINLHKDPDFSLDDKEESCPPLRPRKVMSFATCAKSCTGIR